MASELKPFNSILCTEVPGVKVTKCLAIFKQHYSHKVSRS